MFSNSNSSNISAYSSNPLDHISSQKKLEFNSNSLSAFEIGEFFGKNKLDGKSNRKPKNFVLRLNVEYRKVFKDVIINEVKIDNQGNKTEQTLIGTASILIHQGAGKLQSHLFILVLFDRIQIHFSVRILDLQFDIFLIDQKPVIKDILHFFPVDPKEL